MTELVCPECGAPADSGQLVCLECGARIALERPRQTGWKRPAAIVAIVALLAAAGATFTYSTLVQDAEDEAAAAPPRLGGDASER
jgi:DNA-directed RNA polymerase subunit RPC12/RpoP